MGLLGPLSIYLLTGLRGFSAILRKLGYGWLWWNERQTKAAWIRFMMVYVQPAKARSWTQLDPAKIRLNPRAIHIFAHLNATSSWIRVNSASESAGVAEIFFQSWLTLNLHHQWARFNRSKYIKRPAGINYWWIYHIYLMVIMIWWDLIDEPYQYLIWFKSHDIIISTISTIIRAWALDGYMMDNMTKVDIPLSSPINPLSPLW